MPKRKIEAKTEPIVSDVNVKLSRKVANTLKVKIENIKTEVDILLPKNINANQIKSEVNDIKVLRRSSRIKENLSPIDVDINIHSKNIKKPINKNQDLINKKKEDTISINIKDEDVYSIIKSKKKTIDTNLNKLSKNDLKEKKDKIKCFERPIDKECTSKVGKAEIFIDNDDIYDVMLNQTNLQFNNNKFYLIQLLKDINENNYSVWMRWARVGKIGQMKLTSFGNNLEGAKKCFCQKFHDKTKNDWYERSDFVKVDGKYDLVHIDYAKSENTQMKDLPKVKLETLECKLEDKLQDLLRIVFDLKEMDSAMSDFNYDSDRLPLGRLTESQIMAGYKALREIEGLLNEGYSSNNKLLAACNNYYTRIPHDFGMRPPPIIRSLGEIKRELELLETLSDIKITLGLMEMGDINVHHLDRQYQSLNSNIRSISSQEEEYELLNNYLLKTHGTTHKEYSLEMLELFEVKKDNEWNDFVDFGNRMLLWHGSRTTNYGGILSQGLRIAPKEAPITGHMFGKGVYFSDMSSKSANYIYPTKTKNVGLLLLCEVSLGKVNELIKANERASKLPSGMNSVMGKGKIAPDRNSWVTMKDGVVVPVGEPRETGLTEKDKKDYLLNYNEYIVYNRNQIRMRYMMKVKFNYKKK